MSAPLPAAGPRVDRARPFMPEAFTQLWGSAAYASFTPAQRLRYNQLCGLVAAEIFMAFERDVLVAGLTRLRGYPEIGSRPDLAAAIDGAVADEDEHARMFRALLVAADPALYRPDEQPFTRLRAHERAAAWLFARTHDGRMCLLWLAFTIEVHSVELSRAVVAAGDDGLGPLDGAFVDAHRRHLGDEIGHLELDQRLIAAVFDAQPEAARRRQARWFGRLLGEVATPRRANARVIDRLVAEFPELGPRRDELVRIVREDSRRLAPRSDIAHPKHHPVLAQAWRERPEMAPLARGLERPAVLDGVAARTVAMLGLFVFASVTYRMVADLAAWLHGAPPTAMTTIVDRLVPTLPWAIVPYGSLGAFMLLAAWGCDRRGFLGVVRAGLAAMAAAYAAFLALPYAVDRGPLPESPLWCWAHELARLLDPPLNTWPSLHVAYSTIVLASRRWPWWVWAWWAMIVPSTVATRQHVALDVAGGLALGVACWWVFGRRPAAGAGARA